LCDVLRAQVPLLGTEPGRRVLQAASFNFDASVWEVFAALAIGGTLCMAPREQLLPGRLEHTLTALRPDLAFLTPAVAAALPADLPALPATLLIGGDMSGRANRAVGRRTPLHQRLRPHGNHSLRRHAFVRAGQPSFATHRQTDAEHTVLHP
jgi:non-ribosomal peptide synthetase component F